MKVLILSPHPDDMEYNMGGTVVKMKENGFKIIQIIFSDCIELKGTQFIKGAHDSAEKLRISTRFTDFPNEEFLNYRSAIRKFIYSYLKGNYDIIFVPCRQDWHQDHQVVTEETIRIFRKDSTILGYIKDEIYDRHHDLRVDLTEGQVCERLDLLELFGLDIEPKNPEWFEVIQLRNYL